MGGRGSYSGKSTSSKLNSFENTNTQNHHLDSKSPEQLEAMYTTLGLSNPSGARDALYGYTDNDIYDEIKMGQRPEDVKLIDEVITKQPKWEGEIYRGMNVDDDFIDNLKSSIGDTLELSPNSPTSFSSRKSVAKKFMKNGPHQQVLFVMKNKRGSSITHNSLYPEEGEVLHKSGEKYKIKEVKFYENSHLYVVELDDSE